VGDRVAVVTGAGTGIGRAIAVKFGGFGWRVGIGGRRTPLIEESATLVEQAGGKCAPHRLDVTDPDSVEEFFTAVEAELGPVDIVINNAATGRYGPLDDFAPEEIAAEIATKFTGALYMARRGIQGMRRTGSGGDILFMTSTSAIQPWPFHLPYAAASAGVEHAARILRLELEGTGIRVHVLRCGPTGGTDFGTREQQSGRMATMTEYWFRRGLLRHTSVMTPDVVADAVATAVTLPPSHQYEFMAVEPVAPVGELPVTFDDYVRSHLQSAPS